MTVRVLLLPIVVGVLNVAMNVLARKAAESGSAMADSLQSKFFLGAILVGTASLVSVVAVYRAKYNLAQGILLMGAVSVIGGSLLSVFVMKNRLAWPEWLLLFAIFFLLAYRFFKL